MGSSVSASHTSASSSGNSEPARLDDDEEDEEAPAPEINTLAPDVSPKKQGLQYVGELNGSDVRVGIIMARWNSDIIEGLYKVLRK